MYSDYWQLTKITRNTIVSPYSLTIPKAKENFALKNRCPADQLMGIYASSAQGGIDPIAYGPLEEVAIPAMRFF
jgi:hypothetical protein